MVQGVDEPSPSTEGLGSSVLTPRGGVIESSLVRDDIDAGSAFNIGLGKVSYAPGDAAKTYSLRMPPAAPADPAMNAAPLHFSIPIELPTPPLAAEHAATPPPLTHEPAVLSDYIPRARLAFPPAATAPKGSPRRGGRVSQPSAPVMLMREQVECPRETEEGVCCWADASRFGDGHSIPSRFVGG